MTGLWVVGATVLLALGFGLFRRATDGRIASAVPAREGDLGPSRLGRPLGERATFVQFSSEVCAPCRATSRLLGELVDQEPGVAHVELDAAEHLDLARELGISRTPTVLLLDSEGAVRHRIVGAPRRPDVLRALQNILEGTKAPDMTTTHRDDVWSRIRTEVGADAQAEPALASFLHTNVLSHSRLEDALSFILASKLGSETITSLSLRELIRRAFDDDRAISVAVREDLRAVLSRDPACRGYSMPLLYFKGFHALQAYRVAHYYWTHDRPALALYLQSRISEVFAVDIHPGARIGKGIMFDHATSVVIGETAVVEDDFSMLHEVTLGGTGKVGGDRHPKIGKGVMIGAGAKVLGNIRVGEGARIGAGSVVLEDVPPYTTVAGVPARPVSYPENAHPALDDLDTIER